jgi:hypothetical protein
MHCLQVQILAELVGAKTAGMLAVVVAACSWAQTENGSGATS